MLLLILIVVILLPFSISKMEDVYFAPSVFLNHGGGPYPVLREKYNLEIGDSLKNVSNYVDLGRLKAIVIVTAHREEDVVTISSGERHPLLYDYYNFPPESYEFKYDAPDCSSFMCWRLYIDGQPVNDSEASAVKIIRDPILAGRIHDAFKNAGIQSTLDDRRGWDHGVFIPMMLINPKADIPIVQISILQNQNAAQHYDIGKALYAFRKEGVAIFGSGLSYHNMREFQKAKTEIEKEIVNEEFDNFLNNVCTGDEENRKKIIFWDQQKGGLHSHPLGEADHLMPLIVNAGAGGTRPGKKMFESVFLGKFKLSGFMWDGK